MNRRNLAVLSAALTGLVFSHGTFAAEDEWNYEITPYFLAAGLEGEIGLLDVTTNVDMSFSDIWDHLDAGFMGLFSAQKGRWTLGLEAVYFKLSGAGSKSVTWDRRNRSQPLDPRC